jgi:aerobic carbon-monoxide dehydrogenase small subunit
MSERVPIELEVNGEAVAKYIEPRMSLADFLREELELTGTHQGCEMGACGACLVLLNGKAVHSCLMFAVQGHGDHVETVEGLSQRKAIADIQQAFHNNNALQCGFCTAGMLVTAHELLSRNAMPSRNEIRDGLSGNYCRCTGYQAIVDAIESVARSRAGNVDAPANPRERGIASP